MAGREALMPYRVYLCGFVRHCVYLSNTLNAVSERKYILIERGWGKNVPSHVQTF